MTEIMTICQCPMLAFLRLFSLGPEYGTSGGFEPLLADKRASVRQILVPVSVHMYACERQYGGSCL